MHRLPVERPIQRKWLSSKEACQYLEKSPYTLQRWRSTGIGPRWGKNGHTVIYFLNDLDKWLESTLREELHPNQGGEIG